MNVKIESFSLRHFIPQFREFNSATRENRERLEPYFWWARDNAVARFKLILCGLVAEKIAQAFHDLPYNKKFIIRNDDKFAGVIGLDGVCKNADRADLWIFVTREYAGQNIASHAIKLVEEYAAQQSIKKICARVLYGNWPSRGMLQKNDYGIYKTHLNHWRGVVEQFWCKKLPIKNIEK